MSGVRMWCVVFISLVGSLVGVPAAGAATVPWTGATDLSANGAMSLGSELVVAPNGTAHVAWIESSPGNGIKVASRGLNGLWGAPVAVSAPTFAQSPAIAAGSDGVIYVAWSRYDAGFAHYVVEVARREVNGAWGAPQLISNGSSDGQVPALAVDDLGQAHVFYTRSLMSANRVVQSSTRAVNGTWSLPVDISVPGSDDQYVQAKVAPDGIVHATWSRPSGVQTATRALDGTWSAPITISTAGAVQPTIGIDSSGIVYIGWWINQVGGVVEVARRALDGNWAPPETLAGGDQLARDISIAVAGDGLVHAIWHKSNGTNSIAQTSTRSSGGFWSAPVNLSAPGSDVSNVAIVADTNGVAHAIWNASSGVSGARASVRRANGSWGPTEAVAGAGQAYTPRLGIASNGVVTAAWYQNGGGTFYVRSSTLGVPIACDATASASVNEDATSAPISAACTDRDGDIGSSASFADNSPDGTVAGVGDGTFTFTPNADFNGVASFTVTVSGTDGSSDTIAVTVTVAAVNDAPTCSAPVTITGVTEDGASSAQNPGCADVDGDAVSFTSNSTRGVVSDGAGDTIVYTPNANVNGNDSFTLTASDGTATATVAASASVAAVNDAPVCRAAIAFTLTANTTSQGQDLSCTDVDGTTDFTITATPANGAVTDAGTDTFTYVPAPGFVGTDAFTITVGDGVATTAVAATATVVAGGGTTVGTPGNDTLVLGDGDDRILATTGNDTIDGGAGSDTLDLSACTAAVLNLVTGTLTGCGGTTTVTNIEHVVGSPGNDRIIGNAFNNRLCGGGGNDVIAGGAGRDRLCGGPGTDVLNGGAGNDVLAGGVGNDRLLGGIGADRLVGDAGRDTYFAGSGRDVIATLDRVAEAINCGAGPGMDIVLMDRVDRATYCEVRLRLVAAPAA